MHYKGFLFCLFAAFFLMLCAITAAAQSGAGAFSTERTVTTCPDPANAGSHPIGYRSVTIMRGSRSLSCLLYYPALSSGQNTQADTTGRPYPIIAFGHGFSTQISYYISYYEHLATHGYIAIAPQFPDTQHGELAYDLLYCIEYIRQQNSDNASFLYGAVDTGRVGMSGHSMGGGASLLAASYDSRVRIAAPMAAAETTPSAISVMPNIAGAVCLIAGSADNVTPPSSNQQPMYNAAIPFKSLPLLQGAGHMRYMDDASFDFLNPGTMNRGVQQQLSRRYITAAFDLFLKDDPCGWNYSYGSNSTDPNVTLSKAIKYVAPFDFSLITPFGAYCDQLSGDSIRFIWNKTRTLNPADTVVYTLQTATDRNFTAIRYSQTLSDTSVALRCSLFPLYTNYWRIIAKNSATTQKISREVGWFGVGLPVELQDFHATAYNGNVSLSWKTATETNNDHFEVERSTDGKAYTHIGTVQGNGTSTAPHGYAFTDHGDGVLYYRLKQVDFDGRFEYSPVLKVMAGVLPAFRIIDLFPSPVTRDGASVSLSLPRQCSATLKLFTESGALARTIFEKKTMQAGTASIYIAGDRLSPGSYFLALESELGRDAKRFVVVR